MPKMRTIEEAYNLLAAEDPGTAITKTALRRLIVTGKLPSVKVGTKYLVNMDTLASYLNGTAPVPVAQTEPRGIRKIL